MSAQSPSANQTPFFKCYRSEITLELLAARPNAFLLLFQVAYRAQRTNKFNRYNLAVGEALIGDYKKVGLTEEKYRNAKKYLEKHGFATFKPTRKGTIAKLTNTDVFDPNFETYNDQTNEQATNRQRTGNDQTTTTKNDKNENNDKTMKSRTNSGGNGISSGQMVFVLGKKIDSQKEKMKEYRGRHFTEVAGGGRWDEGKRDGFKKLESALEKLEEQQENLLLESGTSAG